MSNEAAKRHVKFLDLSVQYQSIKDEILPVVSDVLASTAYTDGPFVKAFEAEFAKAHSANYCLAVNNGTSALHLVYMALGFGPGDEVIVPTNTFFATAEAVSLTGATPVFVDCCDGDYTIDVQKIEAAITAHTKAIVPVHLYGQPADMDPILAIAKKHGLEVVEDCAQAHLAQYKNRSVGSIGTAGCFSFYPGKNLGAYGEGGAVLTNNEALYQKMLAIRAHGSFEKYHHDFVGHNFRMSGLQGGILSVKLKHLPKWTAARQTVARQYFDLLKDVAGLILPVKRNDVSHVYHLFVVRVKNRLAFMNFLKEKGIDTGIHYPIPCHMQKAYQSLGYDDTDFPVSYGHADHLVSLPMYPELSKEEIAYVCNCIKNFFHTHSE